MKVSIFLKPAGSQRKQFDNVDQVRVRDGMIELVGTSNDKIRVLAGFNAESFLYWAQDVDVKDQPAVPAEDPLKSATDRN